MSVSFSDKSFLRFLIEFICQLRRANSSTTDTAHQLGVSKTNVNYTTETKKSTEFGKSDNGHKNRAAQATINKVYAQHTMLSSHTFIDRVSMSKFLRVCQSSGGCVKFLEGGKCLEAVQATGASVVSRSARQIASHTLVFYLLLIKVLKRIWN